MWIWVKFRNCAAHEYVRAFNMFLLSLKVICRFLGKLHELDVYELKYSTINFK